MSILSPAEIDWKEYTLRTHNILCIETTIPRERKIIKLRALLASHGKIQVKPTLLLKHKEIKNYTVKETINKAKRQLSACDKILANDLPDKKG